MPIAFNFGMKSDEPSSRTPDYVSLRTFHSAFLSASRAATWTARHGVGFCSGLFRHGLPISATLPFACTWPHGLALQGVEHPVNLAFSPSTNRTRPDMNDSSTQALYLLDAPERRRRTQTNSRATCEQSRVVCGQSRDVIEKIKLTIARSRVLLAETKALRQLPV
jgi:hypothetical protein